MHLAQLNIAKAKYSLEAPEIKEFVDNLKLINALAESSCGFIWRLKDESGDATAIQAFSDVKKNGLILYQKIVMFYGGSQSAIFRQLKKRYKI